MKLLNLKAAIKRDLKKRLSDNVNALNIQEGATIESLLDKWFYKQLIPSSSKNRKWKSATELKGYLKARMIKDFDKQLKKQLSRVDAVINAPKLESITISVEYKKNRVWGVNPRAEAEERAEGFFMRHDSGSIGGCGYDKQSTAIASALNQCNSLLKELYKAKNKAKNIDLKNSEVFGYGSGYGILPNIEGGVGVSCYPRIMEAIGLKFETIANGSSFDVFKVSKA